MRSSATSARRLLRGAGGPTYYVNVAVADTGTAKGDISSVFPITSGQFTIPLRLHDHGRRQHRHRRCDRPSRRRHGRRDADRGGGLADRRLLHRSGHRHRLHLRDRQGGRSLHRFEQRRLSASRRRRRPTFIATRRRRDGGDLAVDNQAHANRLSGARTTASSRGTSHLHGQRPGRLPNARRALSGRWSTADFIVPQARPLSNLAYTVQGRQGHSRVMSFPRTTNSRPTARVSTPSTPSMSSRRPTRRRWAAQNPTRRLTMRAH